VLAAGAQPPRDCLNISRVTFAELDRAWIESYCDSGDPMDKAGAYGVQGRAAEKIIRIEGSFSGVMGLPLYETCQLLRQAKVLF
jgi:septum formation protein